MYIYYFSEGRNYLPKHAEAANPSLTEMPGLNRLSHSARFEAAIGKKKITIIHSNKHHDPRKESENLRMKKRNPGETPSIAISDVPVEETERAQIKKNKKRNSNIP